MQIQYSFVHCHCSSDYLLNCSLKKKLRNVTFNGICVCSAPFFLPFIQPYKMSTYTAGSKSVVRSEAEFQRLSQTIATSIQKILQNGM